MIGQGFPSWGNRFALLSEYNEQMIAVGALTSATRGEVLRWPLRASGRGLSHRLALLSEHTDT